MKIAVTSRGKTLDDEVDPRFGRCLYFVVVDTETLSFEAIENGSLSSGSGAGIQSAQFLSERGIEAVLTGNCGPKAFRTLQAAGIEIRSGVVGSVREAVARYSAGALEAAEAPTVESHSGLGRKEE